jgi:hypothetical protein
MFTRNLATVSQDDQAVLRTLIRMHATPAVVGEHFLDNGAHGVGEGDGLRFFNWHAAYLNRLELFLRRELQSLQVAVARPAGIPERRSVPGPAARRPDANIPAIPAGFLTRNLTGQMILPFWEPWTPIPLIFESTDDAGAVRSPCNHAPPITQEWFNWWTPENLSFWPDADKMGVALSWGPHFWVHAFAGGSMAQLQRAPNAPIFWPWHAFVDNIYFT